MNYGADAKSDRDGELLSAHKGASLFQQADWDSERPLPLSLYYVWNLGRLWNEEITQEEKLEKSRTLPGGIWFFPEKIYEDRTARYFEVTAGKLRTGPEYDAENGGYSMEGGGRYRPATPYIALYQAELVKQAGDDVLKLRLTLVYNPYNQTDGFPSEYKNLSVRLLEGGGYKYVSYITDENPPQEQVDAAFTVMPDAKGAGQAVYVSEELGFTVTFPDVWAGNYTANMNDMSYQGIEEQGKTVEFFFKGNTSVPILSIDAVPAAIWEQVKAQELGEGVKFVENEEYVFVAMPFGRQTPFQGGEDKELFDSMYLTREQIGGKLNFEFR